MVKGYKVFNPDWTCRGFQYEVGKTYEMDESPKCCERGFHFCTKAVDCFNFYNFDSENKVAEVEALGEVDAQEEHSKHCTNKIRIVRELTWHEVLDLVNLGANCTGFSNSGFSNSGDYNSGNRNSGNYNSGDYNSGDYNSGNYNSGNRNSGDYNSGNYNSGNRNSGNYNSGNRNSGNRNSGDYNSGNYNSGNRNSGNYNSGNYNSGFSNSGDYNSGNYNSGDYNSGDYNSGNYNSGNRNSGDYNSGNRNSGNYNSGFSNSGNYNSGNRNSGNRNSGDYNKASNCIGCFNTEDKPLFFFDKPTDMTLDKWYRSDACYIMSKIDFRPADWIWFGDMTAEEKEQHPEAETTGGYLKIRDNSDCFNEWWNGLDENEKNIIKDIPNFDADKFFEITGIRVD